MKTLAWLGGSATDWVITHSPVAALAVRLIARGSQPLSGGGQASST